MEVDDDTPQITEYHFSNGNIATSAQVIETIDVSKLSVKQKKRNSNAYDKNLCKDNKDLTAFINKCLFLDATKGMETVINKVLLPAYVKADIEYKQSEKFKKVVTKALQRLINDPDRKYTHISDVVDTLKFHVSSAPKPTNVSTSSEPLNVSTSLNPVNVSTAHKPMNVSTTSTVSAPINVSTSLKPVNDSTSFQPVNDTKSRKPINGSTTIKPVNVSASHKPINVSTLSKPLNVSTSSKPMNGLTTLKPIDVSISHKPMNISTSSKPMNDSTSLKPMDVVTSSKPVNDSTSLKPMDVVTSSKPINGSTTLKPVNVSASHKPMNVSTLSKPLNVSTSSEPMNGLTTPKPIDVSISHKPINTSTSSKPVNDSTSLKPVNVSKSPKSMNVSTSFKRMDVSISLKPSLPPVKKRVNFITLSTKVSVKPIQNGKKRPMVDSSNKVSPKKSKPEVITLDCDDDDVIPIDEINDHNFSHQFNGHFKYNDEVDYLVSDIIEIQDSQELKIIEGDEKEDEQSSNRSNDGELTNEQDYKQQNNEPDDNEVGHEKENLGFNENFHDDSNKLLVPCKERIVRLEKPRLKKKKEPAKTPEEMMEDQKARRIKQIEAKIENCNRSIAKLDLEEVTDDSANSPYFKCDRLRASIVKLYKELCTLVGDEPPERPMIRLQVREGVPQGPIKRLEKFLNKQADEEGETPFPDFSDVVRCVERANEKDGLGWSKAKIMNEAQAIFTYTGRYLQKRRQQREWKHLRAIAKPEEFEADPAERDEALQARLEANRRLASQREAEVFSKFSCMDDVPETEASTSFQIEEPAPEDSSSDEETEPTKNQVDDNEPTQNQVLTKESNNNDIHKVQSSNNGITLLTDVLIKEEPEDIPIKIQYQGDISLVIDISDSESEDEYRVLTF